MWTHSSCNEKLIANKTFPTELGERGHFKEQFLSSSLLFCWHNLGIFRYPTKYNYKNVSKVIFCYRYFFSKTFCEDSSFLVKVAAVNNHTWNLWSVSIKNHEEGKAKTFLLPLMIWNRYGTNGTYCILIPTGRSYQIHPCYLCSTFRSWY